MIFLRAQVAVAKAGKAGTNPMMPLTGLLNLGELCDPSPRRASPAGGWIGREIRKAPARAGAVSEDSGYTDSESPGPPSVCPYSPLLPAAGSLPHGPLLF